MDEDKEEREAKVIKWLPRLPIVVVVIGITFFFIIIVVDKEQRGETEEIGGCSVRNTVEFMTEE